MDKVRNLRFDRVFTLGTIREFLRYCSIHYDWCDESEVGETEFLECLQKFKNAHPEHAHNVID